MMYWPLLGILFTVALVGCSVGFKKYVYFLSVGYGFAIGACSIATFILIGVMQNGYGNMVWLLILQCLVYVAYGARLSGFLIYREAKSASYRKVLKEATAIKKNEQEKKMPFFVKIAIWLVVGVLYAALVSPVLFRHMNLCQDWILPVIGLIISAVGLVLETVADLQKSAQKKVTLHMVAMKGLYRMCRYPNYFGEIVFWTGVFVAGITAYQGVGQWLTAALAYVCVVYVMFNGAQRLERRQNKNYGAMPEYQAYVSRTPALLPLIPIHHLTHEKKSENVSEKEGV